MKKRDFRVKTRKGSLEQKRNLKRLMDGARKWMKGQKLESIWSLHGFLNPFQNRRIWTFYPIMHFLNSRVYHGRSWRLSKCHIQGLEKWIFLRCLMFKEFLFLEKGLEHVSSLWPNYENKSPNHQISELMSHSEISNNDHQFLETLSKKKRIWLFGKNKSYFEKEMCFGFQTLRRPQFK